MISPRLRLILFFVFFICSILAIVTQMGNYVTFVFIITAFILILGHFRHGPVLNVLVALRKGKINDAELLLAGIKKPEWLSSRFKSYYYFSLALIASHKQNPEDALNYSQQALKLNFLQDNEKAILYYNISRSLFEKRDFSASANQLSLLKSFNITDLHLKKRIEELDNALKKELN